MSISGTLMRGTTPTHTFKIPFDISLIADVRISYGQDNKEIFKRELTGCNLEGDTITITLTQEETFKFDCTKQVQVQVRVLTKGGEVLNSEIMMLAPGRCLNNEVLKNAT